MLLDTCIVIEFLRGRSEAIGFIARLDRKPTLSVVTLTELYAGFRSQKSELVARGFVADCNVLGVDVQIAEDAGVILRHFQTSHGLDVPEALIAATAENHGLSHATLNVKHFPMFKKLKPAY